MTDLFSAQLQQRLAANAPLAARLRPHQLDEVVGQQELLKKDAAFRRMVESGRLGSMLLWGPPGSGKTTLARLVADSSSAHFETLSATSAGVKEVREILASARRRLAEEDRRTVLFIDEIHRFSKNQQDALLPGVEDGTISLIGATTENPFFELTSPLLSRLTLFRTRLLDIDDLDVLLERALQRELFHKEIDSDARQALLERSGGDARGMLNALEVADLLADGVIGVREVGEALQRRIVRYDKTGDNHYDVISAFIKSVRGSDPDAAMYWLHLMLEAGEDPEFIARRLVILASEDVGLADPAALPLAVAAAQALAIVGLPEAGYHLSHATVYLATAPKSNSLAQSMAETRRYLADHPAGVVPVHLRSTGYPGSVRLGHGFDYQYPHDHPGHVVAQRYFPEQLSPTSFYQPSDQGAEPALAERLERFDAVLGKPKRSPNYPRSDA